jgi:hypothetical protein
MTDTKEALRLAEWLDRCAESIEQINAAAMLRTLAAEVEALRADAERYRYLRHDALMFGYDDSRASPWAVIGTCHEDATPSAWAELDAAIDAARAALQGESK